MQTPLRDRILKNIEVDSNGCWLWQRSISKVNGYGRIKTYVGSKPAMRLVHRLSYEVFTGAIPDGLQIDHLCKVRHCVNPNHLEAVTGKENKHRSLLKQQWAEKKLITHCPQGHEYTKANTQLKKNKWGNNCRNCRACNAARTMRLYWKKKELTHAA